MFLHEESHHRVCSRVSLMRRRYQSASYVCHRYQEREHTQCSFSTLGAQENEHTQAHFLHMRNEAL